jgi:hypothetical protein
LQLAETKKKELDDLRKTNTLIPANMSDDELDAVTAELMSKEPLMSLITNLNSSFYIFFARSDRFELESTAFLTERGGDGSGEKRYLTLKYFLTEIKLSYRSRPALLTNDMSPVSRQSLRTHGWVVERLFDDRRNPYNVAQIEKRLQQNTLHLEFGHRLHRNYTGYAASNYSHYSSSPANQYHRGAKIRKDAMHMKYSFIIPKGINRIT